MYCGEFDSRMISSPVPLTHPVVAYGSPTKPSWQEHWKSPRRFVHLAPGPQGFVRHSSMSAHCKLIPTFKIVL